jgi:hypothetical protein
MAKRGRGDVMHRLANFVDHNRGLCAGMALAGVVAIAMAGCQPRTQSVLDPARRVTARELHREVAQVESDYAARLRAAELAREDLRAQFDLRARVVQLTGGLATLAGGGDLSAPALFGSLLQLLTLFSTAGLAYDNRRKDRVIAERAGPQRATGAAGPAVVQPSRSTGQERS